MSRTIKDIASDRILFFSDAVFAIAITLLALDIKLPAVDVTSDAAVWHALGSLGPQYLAFIVSFLTIGKLWQSHVKKYSGNIENNGTLMTINLLMLMAVAFIPFPTSLLSSSPTKAATIVYALNMVLIGLLSAWGWWYAAIKNDFISPKPSEDEIKTELYGPLIISIVFGISIVIAFFAPDYARWTWPLFIPIFRVLQLKRKSTSKTAKSESN